MLKLLKITSAAALGALLALSAVAYGATSAKTASADEVLPEEEAVVSSSIEDGGISTASLCTPSVPTYNGIKTYYCVVGYSFTQEDEHATKIRFKQNEGDQYNAFTLTASEGETVYYAVAPAAGSNTVYPTYRVCRAYCTSCYTYSDYNVELRDASYTYLKDNITNRTGTRGDIPTSYDQTGTVWEHKAPATCWIGFSIVYKGHIADGALKIPVIGLNETSVTINGVTFKVRTGPNKVSIRVDGSDPVAYNMYDTMFAFKTVVKASDL